MKATLKFVFFLFTLMLSVAFAADEAETTETIAVAKAVANPQATLKSFMSAMGDYSNGQSDRIEQALETLQLDYIASVIRRDKGADLAVSLYSVLKENKQLKLSAIPESPEKDVVLIAHYDDGNIEIAKQADASWLFSQQSLLALPTIVEGLVAANELAESDALVPLHVRIKSSMPDILKGGFVLQYWQWLGIFIIIVLGAIADKLLAWMLERRVNIWKSKHPSFVSLDSSVLRPLGLMLMAVMWWIGLGLLGLPDTALIVLSVAVKVLASISAIWASFRVVDILHTLMIAKAKRTENKFDDLLVPLITKSLKVFVLVIGVIFAADNLNIDVTSLLAGLGLGGLAFALAAKDLLGNFFGSLTVLLDRPFTIGDWVIIGDVEGTVEEVGFRSTRIRTFYNSLITLPNASLTTTTIDNMGVRRFRRMKTMLGLTYDTPPEKIDAFCEGVRELVRLHPYMRKDYYQVYFNQYNAASLDILVYVFWHTPDWNTELRERHRFLLDILRLAKQIGVEFAYPTQTLYLKQGDGEPASPAGEFASAMTEAESFEIGQQQANDIVERTLGKGVKPAPVKIT
jgi:MscS family membrane protein